MEIIVQLFTTFFIFIFIAVLLMYSVRIIPQSNAYVVERLGAYHQTYQRGLHIILPIIDRVAGRISLKEQVRDFAPQPVITKDNVTMMIDTVVYFQILDPKLYVYGVVNPINAIENLSATTLRNIIGELELDETLTSREIINSKMRSILELMISREIINSKMRSILDEATDPWGIKVNRVEVKNILPPKDIQEAMEKQMRAERERRSVILTAEGEKRSAILKAEGEREAVILRASGKKESLITEAEGQAQAIERVYRAQALGVELINAAHPQQAFLTLKSLESLEKVANGQATKIIIPSEIQNLAGLLASVKGIVEDEKK